jgi:hypothetical protein
MDRQAEQSGGVAAGAVEGDRRREPAVLLGAVCVGGTIGVKCRAAANRRGGAVVLVRKISDYTRYCGKGTT